MCNCRKQVTATNHITRPQVILNPNKTIPEFLAENGWVSTGQCGCKPPKNTYHNKAYDQDGVVIWANDTVMEIRKSIAIHNYGAGSRDTRVERIAGVANFQHIYSMYFNG